MVFAARIGFGSAVGGVFWSLRAARQCGSSLRVGRLFGLGLWTGSGGAAVWRCCVARSADALSSVGQASDRFGELAERRDDPQPPVGVGCEFVMTAAQIL